MKKKFQFILKLSTYFQRMSFLLGITIFLMYQATSPFFLSSSYRIKLYSFMKNWESNITVTNLVSMIPLTSYIGLSKNSLICSTFHKRILMLIWKKYLCILSFIILIILLYTKNYSTNNKHIQMKWMEKTMSSKTDANQRMGTCKKLKCFTIKNLVLTKNKLHC